MILKVYTWVSHTVSRDIIWIFFCWLYSCRGHTETCGPMV